VASREHRDAIAEGWCAERAADRLAAGDYGDYAITATDYGDRIRIPQLAERQPDA
jgi:hypothetical protein